MERVPYAISQSDVDLNKSLDNSKRELSWTFGWTNSRSQHVLQYKFDDVSGKKVITLDGKDVYNQISTSKGLSYSWETKKGHLFQIESLDDQIAFSIDETPFDQFLFPRPLRTASEEMALEGSSDDDEDEEDNKSYEVNSVGFSDMPRYSSHLVPENSGSTTAPLLLNIDVVNPTVQKNENFVMYTVNSSCENIEFPQLKRNSVRRRYNDFVYLHKQLCDEKIYRGLIIPPLPVKQALGRFEASFLEERRCALLMFLNRLRDHRIFGHCKYFRSFLTLSESQLKSEKNAFFAARENSIRASITDWFGSAMHSLATTVGKYEEVGLGFNPLDVQINEIEQYIEPLTASMENMDKCAKNVVFELRKCHEVLSGWGQVISLLGEMPLGPNTADSKGLSLSQILEIEPEHNSETEKSVVDEYQYLEDKENDGYEHIVGVPAQQQQSSYIFRSDISELTTDDMTFASDVGTLANNNNRRCLWGSQWGGEGASRMLLSVQKGAGDTMTTMSERECNSFLQQIGRTSVNTSLLLKDLANAHDIGISRMFNEYFRYLSAVKKVLKVRNEAKKTFTDSIAVKIERYHQYNNAMESFADSNKIADKLDAYHEAKRIMLENRQHHIEISKNLIADFHWFIIDKNREMRKLAVNVLTYHVLNCQDNVDNWSNTLATLSFDDEGGDL